MSGSLKRLKKKLYGGSKGLEGRLGQDALGELRIGGQKTGKYSTAWRESKKTETSRGISTMAKLVLALAVVVVAIVAGAVVYLFGGFGVVSSEQIELEISGPENISGGDKVSWRVSLRNNNEVSLEHAEIAFEYPQGSKPLNENIKSKYSKFLIERRDLGVVRAGEYIDEVFEAFVFGEENKTYDAKVTLEYRIEGSNAILAKEEVSTLKIFKSPIGLSITIPENINIGQEVEIDIVYSLNAPKDVEGLTLIVDYPSGFEFISAYPMPLFSKNIWEISSLASKEEKRISIRGRLTGENLENKIFRATIGLKDSDGEMAVYGAGSRGTILRRPFLDVDILVNGKSDYIASPGDELEVSVLWQNNLPVSVKNAVLELKLNGVAIDYSRVSVNGGSYRGSDKTIIWNPSFYPTFSFIQPTQEGELKFRTKVLKDISIENSGDSNFKISFEAHMYLGERPEGFEGVDIDGKTSLEVKITSDIQLSRQGYFYSDTISNTGPLPPKIGEETTYTIVWSLTNSSNDLDNVNVYAVLPSYVSWKNNISPFGENISYDPISGRVEWNIGELSAGVGILRQAREVAFQIGFIPFISQLGTTPVLISEVRVDSEDTFTGESVVDEGNSLTTRLFTDPQIKYWQYEVVE